MAVLQMITIKEGVSELQGLLKRASAASKPRLKMLLLMQKGMSSTQVLAAKLGVSHNCISSWKKCYQSQGLEGFLQEGRGGNRKGAINKEVHEQIRSRLSHPKAGFTSYKQAMEWINTTFGLHMKYHAVNKYLKYHFHTKLKVGRKTHIQKDPQAEAAFKKGAAL